MKRISFLILMLCSISRIVHGDISWSVPAAISTALTNASDPRVVMDSGGNVTAIWVENSTIKTSSLPFGGSWSIPTTLSDELNTASKPKLGIDSSGNVTALWIENNVVQTTTLPFGGSWNLTTTPISNRGASNPTLVVDDAGNAVAVWVRKGFIESSTRLSGKWDTFTVLSKANSNNPHLAINNSGKAMAVWQKIVSGANIIVTDLLDVASNTWDPPKNAFVAPLAILQNYPKVTIDPTGDATVAWFQYHLIDGISYQNVRVVTSSLTAGSTAWSLPTVLSRAGIRNPADLTIKLRFGLNGDVLVVWTNSYDGETFTVESAQKLFGGSWPRSLMPQNPSLYSLGFDVAVTSDFALLTSMAWNGVSTIEIHSHETNTAKPIMQGWGRKNLFSTGNNNGFPQCALSLNAGILNAVAVWINFDGSNNLINASTGSGPVVAPPSNVMATQGVTNFNVYQDYFNTISWDASSDPTVNQYNIFRNGIFFAVTNSSTLQFTDHNAIQNGTVTYGIAAFTTNFLQSEIVSFTLNP